jgi:hypothetical protein
MAGGYDFKIRRNSKNINENKGGNEGNGFFENISSREKERKMGNKITNGNIITRLAPRACMYFLYKYIYSLLYMYLYSKINGLGG